MLARQRGLTCPASQAAAVACDRITAIGMAAVTALTAVQPKRAVLWTEVDRRGERRIYRPRSPELHTLLCWILMTKLSHCFTMMQRE